MTNQSSWKVRDGDERDSERILSLRRLVFGGMELDKLDPRFWKWEFMDGPDGKGLLYLAEDGERLAGHFADIPRRFSVNGEVFAWDPLPRSDGPSRLSSKRHLCRNGEVRRPKGQRGERPFHDGFSDPQGDDWRAPQNRMGSGRRASGSGLSSPIQGYCQPLSPLFSSEFPVGWSRKGRILIFSGEGEGRKRRRRFNWKRLPNSMVDSIDSGRRR